MAEKKPNLHKTLLILIAVFLPPFWLIFTDEGSRVSDTTLLWLLRWVCCHTGGNDDPDQTPNTP